MMSMKDISSSYKFGRAFTNSRSDTENRHSGSIEPSFFPGGPSTGAMFNTKQAHAQLSYTPRSCTAFAAPESRPGAMITAKYSSVDTLRRTHLGYNMLIGQELCA